LLLGTTLDQERKTERALTALRDLLHFRALAAAGLGLALAAGAGAVARCEAVNLAAANRPVRPSPAPPAA
jgi:hypothetical protein